MLEPHAIPGIVGAPFVDPKIVERMSKFMLNGRQPRTVDLEAYKRALRDTLIIRDFKIPAEADKIADLYAWLFGSYLLRDPLRRFLEMAAQIDEIQGIALARWDEPRAGSILTVYVLLDIPTESNDSNWGVADDVEDCYEQFIGVLDESAPDVQSNIIFFDTRGKNMASVIPQLPEMLADDDECFGMSLFEGSLRFLAVAVPTSTENTESPIRHDVRE